MKSGYVRFSVLLIAMMMTVICSAAEQRIIKSASANLYSKPDKKATVTDTLKKDDKVNVIDQEGDWYAVRLADKRIGWLHKDALTESSADKKAEALKKISDDMDKKVNSSENASQSGKAGTEDKPSSAAKKIPTPAPIVSEESEESANTVKPEQPAAPKTSDDGEKMATLKVSTGRVRSEPTQDAPIKFELKKGDTVSIIEDKDGWYHLKTQDGKTGWSHQSLFSMDSGTKAVSFKEVKDIIIDKSTAGEEKITFVLGGFYPPKTFVLEEDTPKIVCDFPDTRIAERIKPNIDVNGTYLKKIRVGIHEGPPSKLRVVLDMVPNRNYSVKQTFYKKENYYTLTLKAGE